MITKTITLKEIKTSTINGNTYYYFVDTDNKKYMTSINTNKEKLPFLNVGNSIEITYANETEVIKILKVK